MDSRKHMRQQLNAIAANHQSRLPWRPGKCVLLPSDLTDAPYGAMQTDRLSFAVLIHDATLESEKAILRAMGEL